MDPSPRSLSVIFLEDSESDIEIVYQKLTEGFGCPLHMDSAETEREFLGLIRNQKYDLILADYTLPGYNAPEALRQCLALCPDTPFIVVSGTIGEDTAVEMLKQGAADYVLKDRLERLSFAVMRALESAKSEADKKRAEAEFIRAKEQLEEAQRVAHIGSWEWSIRDGTVSWSDETYRILGFDPNTTKLYQGIMDKHMSQEDCEKVKGVFAAALSEKSSQYSVEYSFRKPDGKLAIIYTIGYIHYGADGLPTAVTGTMQDVTVQKLVEMEICQVKESLQEAQRIAHIGSWDWDLTTGLVYWSDEAFRLFGLEPSSEPVRRGKFQEYMIPQDKGKMDEALGDAIKRHVLFDMEYCIIAANGKTKYIHTHARPRYNAIGEPIYMAGTVQDITERKLAEMEISRAKEGLEEAQRIAHIGSWDWDILHDKLYWSDESFRLLGMEHSGGPVSTGLHLTRMDPADREWVSEAREKALKNHETFDVTYRVEAMDGKIKYIHSLGQAQYNEAGEPVYMSGTMQDVTELKLAAQESARTAEFEHLVAKIASDFINLPLDMLDAAIEKALGMIGENFKADRCSIWLYNCLNETVKCRYLWYKQPEMKTPDKYHDVTFTDIIEFINCHKQNKIFYQKNVEDLPEGSTYRSIAMEVKTRSILSLPLHWGGELIGCYSFIFINEENSFISRYPTILEILARLISNVLHRKEQEEALQQLADNYRLMLDSTSDGVAMYDKDGTILNANKIFAARFGKTVQETMGMRIEVCLSEKRYESLYQKRFELLRKSFDSGEVVNFEDSRDGLLFLNRYHPVYKNGKVVGVTLFSTDITDQKRAEEEARKRADAEMRVNVMTEFFTNVSHELKTPLSLILMQTESMRMHMGDTKRMLKLLDDTTLNAYRLTRLVNNLLDIVKMDSGFMKINLRKRDIVGALRDICDSVAGYASAKSIQLEFKCNAREKQMDLDREKLDRIVLNLLSNAIKHTGESGTITVELEDMQGSVRIRVRDTGEGIPADKLDSIFDRFVQVNNRMSRAAEGCGIGLALVKSMVELHGGRVWAQSETGKGSEFIVELPAKISEAPFKPEIIEGFELSKKVRMELSDLYIGVN